MVLEREAATATVGRWQDGLDFCQQGLLETAYDQAAMGGDIVQDSLQQDCEADRVVH